METPPFLDFVHNMFFLVSNRARIENFEIELASSKSAFDEQCKRWRSAQDNYERQVFPFNFLGRPNLKIAKSNISKPRDT
jgi:hypothetical protein